MIGTRKCGVVVMGTTRSWYVLDNMCVCVCVCVCVTLELIVYFCSRVDPTGQQKNLASMHYMIVDTIYCIT